jgi:PAT family acetyl-CoA transporter-like MFS transporter 1
LQPVIPVTRLALGFTLLVTLCATQDIAVDGWALTLLRDENKTYASTAQTIGLNTGYFLSFTVFLALNSPEFTNKFLRSTPGVNGLIGLGAYLQFWGFMFLLCDAYLVLFKKEAVAIVSDAHSEISGVYKTIWTVINTKRGFLF